TRAARRHGRWRLTSRSKPSTAASTPRPAPAPNGPAMGFLQMAIDIARHHHERFDGKGYPDRLADQNIPLAARLVAVADVYDALRSRRSYKPALSHTPSLELMLEGAGTPLGAVLVHASQRGPPWF